MAVMRDSLKVLFVSALLSFCAYVASYTALACPSNSCNPWYPRPSYRINEQGGQCVAYLFLPAYLIDRQLRPAYWMPSPPMSFSGEPGDVLPTDSAIEEVS